jgi:hypothetical protein
MNTIPEMPDWDAERRQSAEQATSSIEIMTMLEMAWRLALNGQGEASRMVRDLAEERRAARESKQ